MWQNRKLNGGYGLSVGICTQFVFMIQVGLGNWFMQRRQGTEKR